MSRKRVRQIIIIGILLLLLALLAAAYVNYRSSRTVIVGLGNSNEAEIAAPQYLYSFAGDGANRLSRPIGVLNAQGKVFVTDAKRGVVELFQPDGKYLETWGAGKLVVPLYLAENPKTGDIWVSDRRLRQVLVYSKTGKFLRVFEPNLPKSELPKIKTTVEWAPVALTFGPDGTLYVTEILNGHRVLIFNPDGTFRKSFGTAGLVEKDDTGEGLFQFPNSIKISGKEIWVADSNNRRIQVFGLDGTFKRFVTTAGLPRGFAFIPKTASKDPRRIVVVDTLAHDATIWNADKGKKVLAFGTQGVLDGQFSYPNDASVDGKRRIFITDTVNGRVQVWGWPAATNPVPTPTTPVGWALCLSPLLLLPLLALFRRRRFVATADFVEAMIAAGEADRMPQPRVRWEATVGEYERIKELEFGDIRMAELFEPVEHSDADARALRDRYELEWDEAVVLSVAQRAKLFCTESQDMRRLARIADIPVVDAAGFIEKYSRRGAKPAARDGADE